MRRDYSLVTVLAVVAFVIAFRPSGRVALFPRRVSASDRLIASLMLKEWKIAYEYKPSSGRILLSEEDRARALPLLVQFGLPSDLGYASDVDQERGEGLTKTLASMLATDEIRWEDSDEEGTLSIRSSWKVGASEVAAVYRLLRLYFPNRPHRKIEVRLLVGTDGGQEALLSLGRDSLEDSEAYRQAVQTVLDRLIRGQAKCVVRVDYEPPHMAEWDEVEPGDFSQYAWTKSVLVQLFLDSRRVPEIDVETLRETVARVGGARGTQVRVHSSPWVEWQNDLARAGG